MDLENHPMLMGTKRDSVTAQRLYLGLFSLETLDLDPCNLSSLKGWFGNRRDIFFSLKEIQRRGTQLVEDKSFASVEKNNS